MATGHGCTSISNKITAPSLHIILGGTLATVPILILWGRQQLLRRGECNNQSPPNLLNVISLSYNRKPFSKAIEGIQKERAVLKDLLKMENWSHSEAVKSLTMS